MKEKKHFNVRLRKDLWAFLKSESARQEKPMAELIEICVAKFKEKIEKKMLTSRNADV